MQQVVKMMSGKSMTKQEWAGVISLNFDSWFRWLRTSGRLDAAAVTYPTQLRLAESPSHFLAELCGEANDYQGLKQASKIERIPSTATFFNPGDSGLDPDGYNLSPGKFNLFDGMMFSTPYDQERLSEKLLFSVANVRLRSLGKGPYTINIAKQDSGIVLRNVDCVRSDGLRVWFRSIGTALVIRRNTTQDEFLSWLQENIYSIGGISSRPDEFGRQLTSLADQPVAEEVLDIFLREHSAQFAEALGYVEAIAQPRLVWQEGSDESGVRESIPDYLLLKSDGTADILDIKRSVLARSGVTGGRARPKFNSYIQELIAQLSTYKRYFASEANRKYALEHFGIRVTSPTLIGIVGNHDNLPKVDIARAIQNHRSDLTLLNFHTPAALHRSRLVHGGRA
ncbi:MAG: hypothetical protein SF187_29040 [Deltaproteobacteria bacterium]|nr:hypothetical protein [Deltaproteobacteria bacterium]